MHTNLINQRHTLPHQDLPTISPTVITAKGRLFYSYDTFTNWTTWIWPRRPRSELSNPFPKKKISPIMPFNVTFKPSVSGIWENNALMQAVYTSSTQAHTSAAAPTHFKSHLIGPVWSRASISIHSRWPWKNLMGVKEVFTLALRTLIVCLADLANWKRRKLSRSVPLIAPAAAPPSPQLTNRPSPPPPPTSHTLVSKTLLPWFVSRITLGT